MKKYSLLHLFIGVYLMIGFIACKSHKELSSSKTETLEVGSNDVSKTIGSEETELLKSSAKTKQAISNNDSLFVTLERTVCFGKCPAYKIYIYSKGYVLYEGKMNVDKIGKFATRLSKQEIESIKQKVKTINYFELYDKYDASVTDLPSVNTSVALDGYRKSITARYNIPTELKDFQKFIDAIFTDKSWELIGASDQK